MFPILDLLIVGLVVIALSGLRVAQEYERGVVFRLLQRQASSRSVPDNKS
jgi:regulator of protease activity HflC (stomatin/prohibitin superfamily)